MARQPLVTATVIVLALALSGCATTVTVFEEEKQEGAEPGLEKGE